MGRFYKTAKPEFIDFMSKVPEQALLGAIKSTDLQLDQEQKFLTDFEKQLATQALTADTEKQKAKLKEYEQAIQERTLNIYNNPLEAIKEKNKTRQLGTKIHEDVTRGELAAYQANYNARAKHLEEETKRATGKDGVIRVQDVDAAMAAFDNRYNKPILDAEGKTVGYEGGAKYNPETGKYESYNSESLVNYVDASKYAKDTVDGWESHKMEDHRMGKSGNYWYKTFEKSDILGLDELSLGVHNTMMNDRNMVEYYSQQARILSGGDRVKEQQLRDQYFGKIDPNTGELALEVVKDAEGKPVTRKVKDANGNEVEKPIMRPIEEGELMKVARAAADKKDKYDIAKGTADVTADAFALKDKDLANSKALEDYKESLKTPPVIDNHSGNSTEQIFSLSEGQAPTVANIKNAITGKKNNLDLNLHKEAQQMLNLINKSGKINFGDGQAGGVVSKKIYDLMINKKDFVGLQAYLTENNLMGVDGVGTSVKSLMTTFQKEAEDIQNEERRITNLYNGAENQVRLKLGAEQQRIDNLEKKYRADFAAGKTTSRSDWNKLEKDKVALALQIKEIPITTERMLNNELGNPDKTKSANYTTKTVFSTAGDYFERLGMSSEDSGKVQKGLSKITKSELFSNLLDNSQAKIQIDGGKLINYNEAVKQGIISFNQLKSINESGEVTVTGTGGKPITYKIGSTRLVPGNIQGVGQGSYQLTMEAHEKYMDKGKEKTRVRSYEIYIPKEELPSSIQTIIAPYQPQMEAYAFQEDAKAHNQTVADRNGNPEEIYESTANGYIKYFPFAYKQGGQGYYMIGNEIFTKEVGQQAHARYIQQNQQNQ